MTKNDQIVNITWKKFREELTVAGLDLWRPPDHLVRVLLPDALGVLPRDVGAVAEHRLVKYRYVKKVE